MAAITLQTGVNLSPVNDYEYIARTYIAGVDIARGKTVKMNSTTGKAILGIDDTLTVGIAITDAKAGYPVTVMHQGTVEGFDVSAMNYGALVYAAAAGAIDTAGTNVVGRIVSNSESGVKLLEVRLA
jgi:hypothetical protein